MQLDRKRFLSLVSAIAGATACAGTQPPQTAVIVGVEPPPDASAPAPIAVSPPAKVETKPVDASPPVAASTGIWSSSYDPKAKPHTCAELKCPSPTQEAMGALRGACRSIEKRLATEPFQRFLTCMLAKNNTTSTCDLLLIGEKPGECLEGWTETPTVDPATAAKCKPIVSACSGRARNPNASGTLTTAQCQQMMSVTSAKSEKTMIHCITEYCEGAMTLCHGGYG